jgi:hypothetical protein
MRPDKSEHAMQAYDRMEINGAAFRREIGLSEFDKPTPDELDAMTDLLERRSIATGAQVSEGMSDENADGTETVDTDIDDASPVDAAAIEPGGAA